MPPHQLQHDNLMSFTQPIDEWSCESVAQWLAINDLSIYIDNFLEKSIDGEKMLNLDSTKLKVTKLLFNSFLIFLLITNFHFNSHLGSKPKRTEILLNLK